MLTLYGQASVGRGFRINKNLLVKNLHHESLIAEPAVVDLMHANQLESPTLPIESSLIKKVIGFIPIIH